MDQIWHTRDSPRGNLSSSKARKRGKEGLCLALTVLLAKMSMVVQIHLPTYSETWLESSAIRVRVVVLPINRKLTEAKIKINASHIR